MGAANLGGVSCGAGGLITDDVAFAAWLDAVAPLTVVADEPALPLGLAPCTACDEEGRVPAGAAWSDLDGWYVGRERCCPLCRGLGSIAVEHVAPALADLAALDASADDAEGLTDRAPGFLAALVAAVVVVAVSVGTAIVAAAGALLETHARADERDGEIERAGGRDEHPPEPTAAVVRITASVRRSVSEAA